MRSENFKMSNQVRITNLCKMTLETQAPKLDIPVGNYMPMVAIETLE